MSLFGNILAQDYFSTRKVKTPILEHLRFLKNPLYKFSRRKNKQKDIWPKIEGEFTTIFFLMFNNAHWKRKILTFAWICWGIKILYGINFKKLPQRSHKNNKNYFPKNRLAISHKISLIFSPNQCQFSKILHAQMTLANQGPKVEPTCWHSWRNCALNRPVITLFLTIDLLVLLTPRRFAISMLTRLLLFIWPFRLCNGLAANNVPDRVWAMSRSSWRFSFWLTISFESKRRGETC